MPGGSLLTLADVSVGDRDAYVPGQGQVVLYSNRIAHTAPHRIASHASRIALKLLTLLGIASLHFRLLVCPAARASQSISYEPARP